jgi:hypothetical protein
MITKDTDLPRLKVWVTHKVHQQFAQGITEYEREFQMHIGERALPYL